MTLINVSFGIYAFLPQGWLFMIAIIAIECLAFSYYLKKSWKCDSINKAVITANVVSGIIGVLGSYKLNGGWWLVVWFPWVSENEVSSNGIKSLIVFYVLAFSLSVIVEGIINYFMLRKRYSSLKIWKGTIVVNTLSYAIGSLAMYTFSF